MQWYVLYWNGNRTDLSAPTDTRKKAVGTARRLVQEGSEIIEIGRIGGTEDETLRGEKLRGLLADAE